MRLSNSSVEDENTLSAGEYALASALQIISEGIETAVRVGRGVSLEEIDSQGLSVADKFYSEVQYVL